MQVILVSGIWALMCANVCLLTYLQPRFNMAMPVVLAIPCKNLKGGIAIMAENVPNQSQSLFGILV